MCTLVCSLSTKFTDWKGGGGLKDKITGRGLGGEGHALSLRLFAFSLKLFGLGDTRFASDGSASRSRAAAACGTASCGTTSTTTASSAAASTLRGTIVSVIELVTYWKMGKSGKVRTQLQASLPRGREGLSKRRIHHDWPLPEPPIEALNHQQNHQRHRTGPP